MELDRPYTISHLLTSLDGKIEGPYMNSPSMKPIFEEYNNIFLSFKCDAWLNGANTTARFTQDKKPPVDENAPTVPEGDFVYKDDAKMYLVSVDSRGRVAWESNELEFNHRPKAHIIEVLTKKTPNSFKAFLRKLNISYIICGDEHVDCALCSKKLKQLFHINKLVITGGGVVNASFLDAGCIDELSQLLCPIADCCTNTPTLFHRLDYLPEKKPHEFKLVSCEKIVGDTLHLKYLVKKE